MKSLTISLLKDSKMDGATLAICPIAFTTEGMFSVSASNKDIID